MDFITLLYEWAKEHNKQVTFQIVIDPDGLKRGSVWIKAYMIVPGKQYPAEYTQEFSIGAYKDMVNDLYKKFDGEHPKSFISKYFNNRTFEKYIMRLERAMERGAKDPVEEDKIDESEEVSSEE